MSVRVKDRKENKLEVFLKALDLLKYTLKITQNEKVFKQEYKEPIVDDIIETVKNIYIDAWDANNVMVRAGDVDAWKIRRQLQLKAARECNRLLALIDIAKSVYHLDGKRVEYWIGKVLDTRELIRKWNESDSKRYSK